MIQTYLASSSLRKKAARQLNDLSSRIFLEAGQDVKLEGFLSYSFQQESKGLVILIHGWEGSADAPYIVGTGLKLLHDGYDIIRLNLRDHGETHHLNHGFFMGILLEETFQAVKSAISLYCRSGKAFLFGVSLGGNFGLRIARLCGERPVEELKGVAAINPPLDPEDATIRLDQNPYIRSHFLKKWKSSLLKKQSVFPEAYVLEGALKARSCMELTELLIPPYSDCVNAEDYFSRYNLRDGFLDEAAVPVMVITAEDDPIIDVDHFRQARLNSNVELIIQGSGGHCGYIENLKFDAWYHEKVLTFFNFLL